MLLGAHESVAGGLHRAFQLATQDGCQAIQAFTKNANQWREPAIGQEHVAAFKNAREATGVGTFPVLAHDSYLINLCAADHLLRERSRQALLDETLRCEALGIEFVVFHPGAHMGAGVEQGVALAAQQIGWVLNQSEGARVALLVENTAGQGSSIGSRFEEVGAILRAAIELVGKGSKARTGMCLDTCHAFAAGYDLSTRAGFDETWAELDRTVGLKHLRALHLNDSKKRLRSRVDRHERLKLGELGPYPFWRLVNDRSLADVPGVLETPHDGADRCYRQQLRYLRSLRGAPEPRAGKPDGSVGAERIRDDADSSRSRSAKARK